MECLKHNRYKIFSSLNFTEPINLASRTFKCTTTGKKNEYVVNYINYLQTDFIII